MSTALEVINNTASYAFETGDAIEVMQTLPDGCVNVIVVSPPYFGLHQYTKDEVTGGDPDCAHDWGGKLRGPDPKRGTSFISPLGGNRGGGTTCVKCGAERHARELGSETRADCFGWATGRPCGECYTCHLVITLREARRVLRDDGLIWLNMGDSYTEYNASVTRGGRISGKVQHARPVRPKGSGLNNKDLKNKDLMGVPWSVAMALRADGWYLRTDIIWAKLTTVPASVNGWRWEQHRIRDEQGNRIVCPGCDICNPNNGLVLRQGSWRPTSAHEHIFMLAKSDKYFADLYAIRQLPAEASLKRIRQPGLMLQEGGAKDFANFDPATSKSSRKSLQNFAQSPSRNLWDVWVLPPASSTLQHFAMFPPGLPELCIRASTSQAGYCSECGAPYVRIVSVPLDDGPVMESWDGNEPNGARLHDRLSSSKMLENDKQWSQRRVRDNVDKLRQQSDNHDNSFPVRQTLGWKAICDCHAEPMPGVVLDFCSGSGTTVRVAHALGLRAIGIDLNPEYNRIAEENMDAFKLIFQEAHSNVTAPEQLELF